MDREAFQVRKTAITRSEVVNRNLDTHSRKRLHNLHRLFGFAHCGIFSNFKFQVLRIQLRAQQDLLHVFEHIVQGKLLGREVDRHLDIIKTHIHPFFHLDASHFKQLRTQRDNESGFFCNGNKIGRRNKTVLRLVPANERLESNNAVSIRNIDNRLVEQHEFLRLNRLADFEFKLVKTHRLFANASTRELDAPMVDAFLHFTKASRRIRKDILDAVHFAVQGNSHRNANIKFTAFQLDRQLDRIMDATYN